MVELPGSRTHRLSFIHSHASPVHSCRVCSLSSPWLPLCTPGTACMLPTPVHYPGRRERGEDSRPACVAMQKRRGWAGQALSVVLVAKPGSACCPKHLLNLACLPAAPAPRRLLWLPPCPLKTPTIPRCPPCLLASTDAPAHAAPVPATDGSPLQARIPRPAAGQLLPARTEYLRRTLGGRLLPEEAAASLRLCAFAASAVFSNRTPWAQLRADLRREAEAEAALLGLQLAVPITRGPSAPAWAAVPPDKVTTGCGVSTNWGLDGWQ